MKQKRQLGIKKFNSIFLASMIEMNVGLCLDLSDTVITGRMIGEAGLSALNVLAPILGATIFTETLIATGTSMLYAKKMAAYDKKGANGIFGMGCILSILAGILTFLLIFATFPGYMGGMGIQGTILDLARKYMTVILWDLAISPFFVLLSQMVYTDGDEFIGMASNVVAPLSNLGLSVLLARSMGITGIALGSLISKFAAMLVLSVHFFKKSNTLHPRWYFSMDELKTMFVFSWNDSSMFILLPFLFALITKLVVVWYGESYLPVLTIITSVMEMTAVFEATGEALRPILPIYRADGNTLMQRTLAVYSIKLNVALGILFGGVLFLAAGPLALLFGIDTPLQLSACITCARMYAVACPVMALTDAFNSWYLNSGRPRLSMLQSVLDDLICPLILSVPLGYFFGFTGMMAGLCIAPFLTAAILLAAVKKTHPHEDFPWLIEKDEGKYLLETIQLSEPSIASFVSEIHTFLQELSMDPKIVNRVELLAEETLHVIRDRNEGKEITAECFLHLQSDGICFSIWDNGKLFNLLDEDATVQSFRIYVTSNLLKLPLRKNNMVMMSFNRNTYTIPNK